MEPEYLDKPPNRDSTLPIRKNQMELPIRDMGWEDFEKLCLRMVEFVEGFQRSDCEILGRKGQKQDGIDIYARKEPEKYYTFQCKRYSSITVTDLNKVISAFKEGEWFDKSIKFYICTTADFMDVKLQTRFEEIKDEFEKKYTKQIVKWDSSFLNSALKTHPQIVCDFFGDEWCKAFCGEEAYNQIVSKIDFEVFDKSFTKASYFLSNLKNYFAINPNTHIHRKESKEIIDWINADLKSPKRNLLVLEGEKGMGKSVILKDVYDQLVKDGHLVLGIKADKYYALSPKELENKIFLDDRIKFSSIIRALNIHKRKLTIIIDQLDALSQTLSSNRQYIQTYSRVINELLDEKNIKIIISSRTYDLKYDAELSIYKSNQFHNIKASLLNENEVSEILQKFKINCSQKKVIELLRTPNHLEIFCKLPHKDKINLNTLFSLKDLYDTLWEELIAKEQNPNLSKLLYEIATRMYDEQQIIVKNQFFSEYGNELNYLLSNQLIVSENKNIQFFHQTFYDYCFSRQFVEKGNSIYTYLNENEQNLEVRSILKMVFEYLREYDHKKYILQIQSILKSSKYRFHIKSLIINNLGILESPSYLEKEVVNSIILKNKIYEDIFLHSILSKDWTNYLIELGIPTKFLLWDNEVLTKVYTLYKRQTLIHWNFLEQKNPDKIFEYKRNVAWIFLRNNVNYAPLQVMQYLEGLPDFKDKDYFIERILMNLDDWEEKELLPYFEKYMSFLEESKGRDNFWFYQKLEKIFEHHELYVFNLLLPIFNSIFYSDSSWHHNEFSHDQEELIKRLYGHSPEKTFKFIFQLYEKVLDDNQEPSNYEGIDCPFYNCTKFIDGLSTQKDAHIFLQDFLVKHLKSKLSDKKYIIDFFDKYKDSNAVFILRILVLALNDDSIRYPKPVFELINIIHHKSGLNGYDDKFQLYIRQLIGTYFSHFSDENKKRIAQILLTIKSPYDLGYHKYEDEDGKQKIQFRGFGKKCYYFLKQLPKNELDQIPELKKAYQEFFRRFGAVNSDKAHDISSSSGAYAVGPPLSSKAYEHMDLENWKKSMSKFNDSYREGYGPKGGKHEHSRAFGENVKNDPDKYYDFIKGLFEEKGISADYISKGIDGLIDAKYCPKQIKWLFDLFVQLDLDMSNTLHAIWQSGYLIQNNQVDEVLVNFLSDKAKNHPNPQKPMNENDPSFDSLNTVRGAAIHKLMWCYEHSEFEEIIFDTVEKAVHDPQVSVRVAVMQELAYLNYLDLQRSFTVFMSLIQSDDIHILRNSFSTSQYFNVKFHKEMYPYFMKIIKNEELHSEGNVIVLSWLDDNIDDGKLYRRFVRSSDKAKLCALKIAEANLFERNGMPNEKSFKILHQFLNQDNEEIASAYSGLVLRKFKNNNFKETYSFLIAYSKSKLCLAQPSYFLQLLMGCTKEYPVECLKLVGNMKFDRLPDIQRRGYYRDEPVQLILSIYSKLNMNLKENRKLVNRTLDIFDSMLRHNHLRVSVNQAIRLTT